MRLNVCNCMINIVQQILENPSMYILQNTGACSIAYLVNNDN